MAIVLIESSILRVRIWVIAITLISPTKKGFSAAELRRQLRMRRYEPVFRMYNKLRVIMGKRDDRYMLEDMFEYDEAFVGKPSKAEVQGKLERWRGTQKQFKVAVIAESTVLEDPDSGKLDKGFRC